MARKSAAQDGLRLLVDTLQKVPLAFVDIPRKNVYTRPLSAAFSHRSRGSLSGPLRRLEKVQLQTAFGFLPIPCEKFLQPSEMYPERTFRPDRLWLLDNPLQKASQAFGDVPRKNVETR